MPKMQRLVMEIGLRPFKNMSSREITRVCKHALKCWEKLIDQVNEVSILFWTSDGSEIIEWDGNMNKKINWGRHIGFCNLDKDVYPVDISHYWNNAGFLYKKNPPVIRYKDIAKMAATFKKLCNEMFGKKLSCGLTFDAGPEFAQNDWKFKYHREIITNGPKSKYKRTMAFINFSERLHADKFKYAGYPKGIPEGTPFGEFLGRQTKLVSKALGFDYIWFSNGFGFTPNSWYVVGKVFDGDRYYTEKVKTTAEEILFFWEQFRKECPDLPIEIRGTDFNVGLDISKDAVPLREIYRIGNVKICAPNPPWGSRNLGQEVAIYLSRISELPGKRYPYRFYVEDPWFISSPWKLYYGREPYDIYSAMSVSYVDSNGNVKNPTDIELLTISDEKGGIYDQTSNEVIPHMRRAIEDFPDESGLLVWLYPFSEYNDMIQKHPKDIPMLNLYDVYINTAAANGLPLNTVISTDKFAKLKNANKVFKNSILIVPVPIQGWKYEKEVMEFVKKGGKAIFYGNLKRASKELRDFLNISLEAPIEGELKTKLLMQEDKIKGGAPSRNIVHRSKLCDGGISEVLKKREKSTEVRAIVSKGKDKRIYAVARKMKSWHGGMAGWIRATLPFDSKADQVSVISDDMFCTYNTSEWLRHMLRDFGYVFNQERINIGRVDMGRDPSLQFVSNQKVQNPISDPIVFFVSKSKGAYFLNGYKPDSTVSMSLSFPDGAPVVCERETIVENSTSNYHFDKSFHYECRVFVKQKERSIVLVKQRIICVSHCNPVY